MQYNSKLVMGGYSIYKHCLLWKGLPNLEPKITASEAKKLMKESDAWMLRNIYDWDCKEKTNFWFIIKDSVSDSDYSKKTKKYIQKANNRFKFTLISRETLKTEGYRVYLNAFRNYKVKDGFMESEDAFMARIDSMDERYDIWGAIDLETGRLEAYSICRIENNVCLFESSKANPCFLSKYYIMYGLYDARNHYYLEEQNMKFVVSSARSISEHSNIQSFLLEKFAFRKAYCRFNLYYTPWFKLAINILYPFRSIIPIAPIINILKFETIRRGG